MSSQKELTVVSLSKEMVKKVYELCKLLPESELYGIISQMKRSSVSVPSNIVEGSQRGGKDFIRFIDIARGSLMELKVQLEICQSIYNIEIKEILNDIDQIGKMTWGLIKSIKTETDNSNGGLR